MSQQVSSFGRREFLSRSAGAIAAGTAAIGCPAILSAKSPNERLNLAFIGVGGRGLANLNTLTSGGADNVVAVCDVNSIALGKASQRFPKARTYVDFRKLYEDADDIDAVVVSVAEHTHAYATMPALKEGKHVYCEKPLTYNVDEARQITEAAAKANVATQMGTQIHGMPNYHRVVELIQSGAIGNVTDVHVWVGRAWGLQSAEDAKKHRDIIHVTERPQESVTPPKNLNWDLWLGPAPYRPFNPVYVPGPRWYRWWDFGNGTMSDLGSHWVDLPFWALQLDAPKTIEAFGPPPHPEIAPASMKAVYEYGARQDLPPCKLTWYQGAMKPEILQELNLTNWNSGVLFVGDRGMLISDYGKHKLLPEKDFEDFEYPEQFTGNSPGHHKEWLIACKTGSKTASPFSYAGPLTEANHLGNVAYRVDQKLHWDAAKMEATGCPEADPFLKREPRQGWSL
ncbi:Gfo/Idh/MocA family protein [Thalassoroseus pseudoceratinae]|uniref:Gfo/Idh/MocA family protein n=1 Tax=Thalassoroseus pseudoceratinae TaxID=2713176 RepID=UPI00141F98C6|nr:Gfo/Idh/MocA family oxidoreductase [Thalassoroseus pseudoceratinae]